MSYEPPAPPPPPPPGGQGPPPQSGYGVPPPGDYGIPPQGGDGWDLGAALSWAWSKFQANLAQLVLAALALVAGMALILILGFVLVGALTSTAEYACDYDENGFATSCGFEGGTPFVLSMVLFAGIVALTFLYSLVVGAGIIRGALGVTEGRPFRAAEVFRGDRLGPVLATSLIIAGAGFVGLMLCYVPGIIVMFVTSYALYFVLDKGLAPMEAIKASFELVKANLGATIVWYIVGGLIGQAGFLLCGVGGLVSLPIMYLGTAYTYKKLTHQPVAA